MQSPPPPTRSGISPIAGPDIICLQDLIQFIMLLKKSVLKLFQNLGSIWSFSEHWIKLSRLTWTLKTRQWFSLSKSHNATGKFQSTDDLVICYCSRRKKMLKGRRVQVEWPNPQEHTVLICWFWNCFASSKTKPIFSIL